jgi:putative oxidoreductase
VPLRRQVDAFQLQQYDGEPLVKGADGAKMMTTFMDWLILGTEHQARYFSWRAPLAARIVVGWVFMWSGWTKLHNLPVMIENFARRGISFPSIMTPFV